MQTTTTMQQIRQTACDTADWANSLHQLCDQGQENAERMAELNAKRNAAVFGRSDRTAVLARVTIDGIASVLPMAAALVLARGARRNGSVVVVRLAK